MPLSNLINAAFNQLLKKGIEKLPESNAKIIGESVLNKQPDMKTKFERATAKALEDSMAILHREGADYAPVIEMIAKLEWFPCLWEALITGSGLQKEIFLDTLKNAPVSDKFLDLYGISFEVWSEVLYTRFNQEIVNTPDWSILIEIRRLSYDNEKGHSNTQEGLDKLRNRIENFMDSLIPPEPVDIKDRAYFDNEHRQHMIQSLSNELSTLTAKRVKSHLRDFFNLDYIEEDDCDALLAEHLINMEVHNAMLQLRSAFLKMDKGSLDKYEADIAWQCGSRMMGVILLGSVDPDWLYDNQHQGDIYSEKFELVIQTFSLLGTEIALAAVRKLTPTFSEAIEGRSITGRYAHNLKIDIDILPEDFVKTIKKTLFKKMNPSGKIPEFDKPIHNRFLNAAIENRIIEKHQPYIVIDQQIASGQEPLVREVQQIIKRDIPKLVVLQVSLDGQGGSVVMGEIGLQTHVANFLESKFKFLQQYS